MSWDQLKIDSNSKFLKIDGGSYADVHILDDHPKKELVHGGGKDRVSCLPGCNLCGDPELPQNMRQQERWKTNVYDRKDGKVKIWEFGSGVAGQIKAIAVMLAEDGQTVHSIDFRIAATGSNKDKRYQVMQKVNAGPLPSELKLWPL